MPDSFATRASSAGDPPAPDLRDRLNYGPVPARRRRLWRVLALVVVLLVVAAAISSFVTLDEYAIIPGTAQDVGPLIGVPAAQAQKHPGGVYLTDVDLVQVRALTYLYYRFNSDDELTPISDVTGQASVATYNEQGVIDMATARQAATVAAFSELGYPVHADPTGAIVYQLEQQSAVAGTLAVGDVVTAFGGHPVTSLDSLGSAVQRYAPGDRVTVKRHRIGIAKETTAQVTLGSTRLSSAGGSPVACTAVNHHSSLPLDQRNGKPVPCLGIYLEQLYSTVDLPFQVNINSEGIIGPSAGLAFALGLIQKLDPKSLTGGRKVAATGTMSIDGTVGDVGGVAQKTVAVRRAGASIFFVPTPEYQTALSHAGKGLKVYAVNSLAQAVGILERMGGAIGKPTRS